MWIVNIVWLILFFFEAGKFCLRKPLTERVNVWLLVLEGPAEAQRLLRGGEEWLGGEGGDGLPSADEDEIHGGGRPRRHVGESQAVCFLRFVEKTWAFPCVPCRECCGALEHYDKAFDRVTTRNEKQLKSIKRIFHTVTTTDDPVIRKVGGPFPKQFF